MVQAAARHHDIRRSDLGVDGQLRGAEIDHRHRGSPMSFRTSGSAGVDSSTPPMSSACEERIPLPSTFTRTTGSSAKSSTLLDTSDTLRASQVPIPLTSRRAGPIQSGRYAWACLEPRSQRGMDARLADATELLADRVAFGCGLAARRNVPALSGAEGLLDALSEGGSAWRPTWFVLGFRLPDRVPDEHRWEAEIGCLCGFGHQRPSRLLHLNLLAAKRRLDADP